MVGLGAADDSHAVAGTCSTSEVPNLLSTMARGPRRGTAAGIVMDIAANAKNAITVASTFAGLTVSSDQGKTWAKDDILGMSQSVNPWRLLASVLLDSGARAIRVASVVCFIVLTESPGSTQD